MNIKDCVQGAIFINEKLKYQTVIQPGAGHKGYRPSLVFFGLKEKMTFL